MKKNVKQSRKAELEEEIETRTSRGGGLRGREQGRILSSGSWDERGTVYESIRWRRARRVRRLNRKGNGGCPSDRRRVGDEEKTVREVEVEGKGGGGPREAKSPEDGPRSVTRGIVGDTEE